MPFLPPTEIAGDKSREVQPPAQVDPAKTQLRINPLSKERGQCGVNMRGPEAGNKTDLQRDEMPQD